MSRLVLRLFVSPVPGIAQSSGERPSVNRDTDSYRVVDGIHPPAPPPPETMKRGWRGWLGFAKGPAVDSSQANLTQLDESMLNLP